jgi:outer membrane scaffolding protein for murein synthesis (MipA/OmpV family)
MVMRMPVYVGSEEYHTVPMPYGELSYKNTISIIESEVVTAGLGLGLKIPNLGPWTLGTRFFIEEQGRKESDAKALKGMGDRNAGTYAGVILGYRTEPFFVSLEVDKGLSSQDGRKAGLIGGLKLGTSFQIGQRGGIELAAQGIWGNADNLAWDFGINAAQAQRRAALVAAGNTYLRPADTRVFTPGSGLREVRFSAGYQVGLTQNLTGLLMADYTFVAGDARNSPLTRSKQGTTVALGLMYRLLGSGGHGH